MSDKLMLSQSDLEAQTVLALPDRTLLQQTNTVDILAVIAQTSFNQCDVCTQENDNVFVVVEDEG